MAEGGGGVAIALVLEAADFIEGLGKAAGKTEDFGKKIEIATDRVAKYTVGLAAAAVATTAGLYVSASQAIDRQLKLARSLDSTVASVQTLEHAADLAGISHEEMSAAADKLNRKLGEAITVGGNASKELKRLGLDAKELATIPVDERFAKISNRLVELNLSSAQGAAALKELGIKGSEMVAMMMDGGAQIDSARKKLEELNVTVSDVDARKIEAANDAWTDLKLVVTGVANTLTVELAPYIKVIADHLHKAAVESGGFKNETKSAVETVLVGFAKAADVVQGLRVVFKGVELVVVAFGAAAYSVAEGVITFFALVMDEITKGINLAIAASNKLLGTKAELLSMPSESGFMDGLHSMGDEARNAVVNLRKELGELAMQPMPSDRVKQFLAEVKAASEQADVAKKKKPTMPAQNEEDSKHQKLVDGILGGLQTGTEAMRIEMEKRKELLEIYHQNTLSLDTPYYAQQLADIRLSEAQKEAELLAGSQKEKARRDQQRAENIVKVGDDRAAIAAIVAQYDEQERLAEENKQLSLTQIQEEAQRQRDKLRKSEMNNALSVALNLGQQLMGVSQGHSKRAFEFSKKVAIASAVIDGYKSATAAWSAGMSTGGPWAPAIAAAYTAASLLKTGSIIQGLKSTSFGGGGSVSAGGGGGGGGEGSAGTAANAAQAAPNAGQTMFVKGLDPNHLFTGAAVKTIADGLLSYQKDGGKVVFSA